MNPGLTILLAVGAVAFFVYCGYCTTFKNYDVELMISFLLGVLMIITISVSPLWNPSGLPILDIEPGTFKVAFVYIAGENVNIAVEWRVDEKTAERIYHYQFKKDAFEGNLNPNAKKLVVVQSGSFKKLRLE